MALVMLYGFSLVWALMYRHAEFAFVQLTYGPKQISVLGQTRWARGGQASGAGTGFYEQNLRRKYITCVGTNL